MFLPLNCKQGSALNKFDLVVVLTGPIQTCHPSLLFTGCEEKKKTYFQNEASRKFNQEDNPACPSFTVLPIQSAQRTHYPGPITIQHTPSHPTTFNCYKPSITAPIQLSSQHYNDLRPFTTSTSDCSSSSEQSHLEGWVGGGVGWGGSPLHEKSLIHHTAPHNKPFLAGS